MPSPNPLASGYSQFTCQYHTHRCLAGFPNAHECEQGKAVSENGCLFRAAKTIPCRPVISSAQLSGAWLSFVYPTGASAVKFAGHFGAVKLPTTASSESRRA